MESGDFQRSATEGGQNEDGNRRWGNGEKRGKGCSPSTTGGRAAKAATKKGPTPAPRTATLPRTQRTSAVTLTLNEGTKISYAEVIATARRSIPLTKIDVKAVGMRKAPTGTILIKVPGDKGREKASQLATYLSKVLDPTRVKVAGPTRTADLKVVGIDISMEKEELRQALALAAGCGVAEIQVWETGVSRDGSGSAYVKCPAAGARKLAQAGKVALGWSIARVIAIPKRPLQCFK